MKKQVLVYAMLFGAGLVSGYFLHSFPANSKPKSDLQTRIDAALSGVLVKHNLDRYGTRPRPVSARTDGFVRTVRRVTIPKGLNILELHHDLRRDLEGSGVKVIATERSENASVTIHIKSEGIIVQSVVFLIREEKN